eukprot:gnl/Chilomastix_caulleri/3626.p1 GENE.gnl/Chilomastix_caulleri/3626~~gnl/Chilomastix_caulleri/3626.p1  ORF type:complete len:78 (-),score=9.71 gnl/Chilomastix_caulleri/3626:17-250(-)
MMSSPTLHQISTSFDETNKQTIVFGFGIITCTSKDIKQCILSVCQDVIPILWFDQIEFIKFTNNVVSNRQQKMSANF